MQLRDASRQHRGNGTLVRGEIEIVSGEGTADAVAGFLPVDFISGRTSHVSKIHDGWFGRVGVARDRRVRANSDRNHRQRKPAAAAAAASDTSFQGNWRGSKLVGLNVYNDSNESLGSINDLLMDKSGNIKGVVIGVGGFLGVGEHLVAMPFDKVKFVNEPIAYTGAAGAAARRVAVRAPPRPRAPPTPLRLRRRRSPIRGIRITP